MMRRKIGYKLVLEGDKEYKEAISDMKEVVKEFRTEIEQTNEVLSKEVALIKELNMQGSLAKGKTKETNSYTVCKNVPAIVKFYYGLTREQYKHVLSVLKSDRKNARKDMAALAATNMAILLLLLLFRNHLK